MNTILTKPDTKPERQSPGVLLNRVFVPMQESFFLIVPEGYSHGHFLGEFRGGHRAEFKSMHYNITDAAFSSVSTKLVSGQRIMVRFLRQKHLNMSLTMQDRLDYLRQERAVFLGPYGLALIYKFRRDQLITPGWYMSLDERQNLPRDSNGKDVLFPVLGMHLDGVHPYPGDQYDFDLWSEHEPLDMGDYLVHFSLC